MYRDQKIIITGGFEYMDKNSLLEESDVVVVLDWKLLDSIKNSNKDLIEKGTRFLSIKDLMCVERCNEPYMVHQYLIELLDESYKQLGIKGYLDKYSYKYERWLKEEDYDGTPIKILKYLQHVDKGIFIEVGAANGSIESNSNTKILEDMGWTGVLVEPNFYSHDQCKVNRPNCKLERFALVSFDYDKPEIYEGDIDTMVPKKDEYYPTSTLTRIAEINGLTHVDFLSLDVEGYELEVLKGIDFNVINIVWILVECNTNKYSYEELESFLLNKGYDVVANISNYTKENCPSWPGTHQDYLFKKRN